MDELTVDLLESDHEHGPVRFAEYGRADLDHVVGPDGEEEAIERGVVELAESDIGDDILAKWRDAVQRLMR